MNSPHNFTLFRKILLIIGGGLTFGFGRHIRGSGTSDPTVAIALLLLYIGLVFGRQNKFEFTIFGLITLLLRVMWRGWGTFVAQAGIPGIFLVI
jgi:hypothetical protein